MSYRPEPVFRHDRAPHIGVLLVNLGTPDAPTPAAVRRYLAEFLTDPRVVEIPRAAWRPLLHGVVLRTRPAKSAARYQAIWRKDGSPLALHTSKQRVLLSGYLGQRLKALGLPADHAAVEHAMRYGEPSIAGALDRLREAGASRILVVPLYPQYAASTTGSVVDALGCWLASARRALERGDPYHCYCQQTARLLARELGLESTQWSIAFQSRFGRGRWLEPYTAEILAALGKRKLRRVDVFAPGFVADCLETLEELAIEGKRQFQQAGGGDYNVLPCLNESGRWMDALADLTLANLQGWLAPPPSPAEREATLLRAKALGANK